MRIKGRAGRCRQRRRQLHLIERGRPGPLRGVDHDELTALGRRDAIPESIIALPRRPDSGSKHKRIGVVAHPFLSPRIVRGG